MSRDSSFRPNSDPRYVSHPMALAFQNHRVKLGSNYYTYALCPVGCGVSLLRRLNQCTWPTAPDLEAPISKTKCRSCAMKGKKNRTPTHGVGTTWITQGYLMTKRPDGSIVHVARMVMEKKLGRPLSATDRVRFKDGNSLNLDPENLILESELIKLERACLENLTPYEHRKTPAQVAAAALERVRAVQAQPTGTQSPEPDPSA